MNTSRGFRDRLRVLFGLEIAEASDLEAYCDQEYDNVPMPAYQNKRRVGEVSYPVYLSELIVPGAWKIAQFKLFLSLASDRLQRVKSVGNALAKKLTWTDDKNLDSSGDYYLYPSETLTLGKGDCEDHAFVMASCLPDDLGVAYGFWDDGKTRYGHAFNVFVYDGKLWVLDTVGDRVVCEEHTPESVFKIHYIVTQRACYKVKGGVVFGVLAGWND